MRGHSSGATWLVVAGAVLTAAGGCRSAGALPETFDAAGGDAASPAASAPSRRALAIGVGEHLSCALLAGGEVRCWGSIGLASTPQSSRPAAVGIDDVVSLAVGPRHVCVARRDGTVWCWGDNRDGQLGDGTTEARGVPVRVHGIAGAVEVVAGGHHSCARDGRGAVWCWGNAGTVGHPRARAARRPGRVVGLAHATRLVAGDDVTCAFVDGGAPRCWGFNTAGLFGRVPGPVPRAVSSPPLARAVTFAIGFRQVCLTQADGHVWCGGDDQFGQLGDQRVPDDASCDPYAARGVVCRWTDPPPPAPDRSRCQPCPEPPGDFAPPPPETHEEVFAARNGFVLAGGMRAIALGAGHGRSCAIVAGSEGAASGAVTCWGQWYGADDWAHRTPRAVDGTAGAVALAVAEEHACALLDGGEVRCWGYDRAGELGDGKVTELMIASPPATVPFP